MVKDPNILLSIINMKLRDNYSSLEELCDDLDYDREEMDSILNPAGYFYDSSSNQYKQKE